MRNQFRAFLIQEGYSEYTPSGNPSTVYDYMKRIDKVCEWEHLSSWNALAVQIGKIHPQYEDGGCKEAQGRKSHNAVRSALRCFETFVRQQYK